MRNALLACIVLVGLASMGCSSSSSSNPTDVTGDTTQDALHDVTLDTLPDSTEKDEFSDQDATPDAELDETSLPDQLDVDQVTPDEVEQPDLVEVTEHINMGKYWLENAEPIFALREFEKAIELSPVHLQEAYFGAGLARFISAGEILGMLMSLPAQLAGYNSGDGTKKIATSENDFIMETASQAFADLRSTFVEAEYYMAQVEETDEVLFEISGAPMYFTVRPIVVFRGKFDLGDLYLIRSASNFGLWAAGFLAAQSLNSDLGVLVDTIKNLDDGIDVFAILNILSYLMTVNESFLDLGPTTGEDLFHAGAQNMKDSGSFLVKALDYLEAHPDQGTDHVTAYDQSGSNTLILFRNKVVPKDLSEKQISLKFSANLIQDMKDLLVAMETEGSVVPWSKGPAVQLGTAVALLQAVGIMDYVPIELPVDISTFGPDQMVGILRTFLNDAFGFDYTSFFAHPAGLRAFLPKFFMEVNGEERMLVEWECPEELAANGGKPTGKGSLFCSEEAVLTDAAHFAGTPYEMPADGVATPLPYLIFVDPTWSTFLRVAEGAGTGTLGPGWLVPDQDLMNKGLHEFMKGIMGLLQ